MAFNPLKTLAKALGIGLMAAALSFFVGNVLAIIAMAFYQAFTHAHPDYAQAYRVIAAPFGALMFLVAFIAIWVMDIRSAHRQR